MVKLFCVTLVLTIITHEGLSLRCYTCNTDRYGDSDPCQHVPKVIGTTRDYIQECPQVFYNNRQPVCRSTKEIKKGKVFYIRGCASEPSDTPMGDCTDRYSNVGSRIQQCETCDTDNCNIGQIKEINLGLVSTNGKKTHFNSEEMDRLTKCIGNTMVTIKDSNIRPHFEKTFKGPGYLIAMVQNNSTEDWLRSHTDHIGLTCGLPFKVERDVPPAYFYKGLIYDPNEDTVEDVFKCLENQNVGLLASNWTLIQLSSRIIIEGKSELLYIVSVDHKSANVLNKIGGNVFYKMGTINLTPYVEDDN